MPQFGLKGIKCAKYVNTNGVITYTNAQDVGDAMNANIELTFSEARLYAEDALSEFLRMPVSGTISLGVKYIKTSAQKLLFGMQEKSRSVSYTPVGSNATATATVTGLITGGSDEASYVGVAFYAPDMVDNTKKYTCVFIRKALFGPPSMTLQTKGREITFQTPTTTGEFMADDSTGQNIYEVVTVDDENEAKAWITAVLA